jgi:hypothetical protein
LASFLRRNPNIAAVSSHHLRYPKPAVRHMVLFDCCFLRHPLDRLDSLYRYLRNLNTPDPLCVRARLLSPGEFFRQLMNESPHLVSNIQVTHPSRIPRRPGPRCHAVRGNGHSRTG